MRLVLDEAVTPGALARRILEMVDKMFMLHYPVPP